MITSADFEELAYEQHAWLLHHRRIRFLSIRIRICTGYGLEGTACVCYDPALVLAMMVSVARVCGAEVALLLRNR